MSRPVRCNFAKTRAQYEFAGFFIQSLAESLVNYFSLSKGIISWFDSHSGIIKALSGDATALLAWVIWKNRQSLNELISGMN